MSQSEKGRRAAPRPGRARRALRVVLAVGLLALVAVYGGAWLRVLVDGHEPSISVGQPAGGSLTGGHPIAPSGHGYQTYSYLGSAVGRQYVNGAVRELLVGAFGQINEELGHSFVVGETGWPSGGRFQPHRTHSNGLSVDIFVPLVGPDGDPTMVSCWPWNLFCYGLELDEQGRIGDRRVDFDALARLLYILEARSVDHGLRVAKVIIAPEYRRLLLDTPHGQRLGPVRNRILRRAVWVRHDDHVHVDFGLASARLHR